MIQPLACAARPVFSAGKSPTSLLKLNCLCNHVSYIHMHTHLHTAKNKKILLGVVVYDFIPSYQKAETRESTSSKSALSIWQVPGQIDSENLSLNSGPPLLNTFLLPIAQCHVYLDLITRLHSLWAEAILSFLYIPSWLQDLAQKEQNMYLLMKIRCSGYYHLIHQWDHFKGKGWEEC